MTLRKKAFTLLEIMVAITIIGIIAIAATKLNFNALSDRQKIDGFFYKIKTSIETIQNNALIGKAIKLPDNSIIVPKNWKIDFSNSGSGKIIYNYFDGTNYKKYSQIIPNKFYSIEIKNNNSKLTDTGSIIINGGNLSLTGAGILGNDKVLEIKTSYKNFDKTFTINTISGVIEEK